MPKSSRVELAELREAAVERDGGCKWPTCDPPPPAVWYKLEMAHLAHRKMGGSKEADTLNNVIMLCQYHHDLFDGRTHDGLHRELAALLRTLI